MTALSRSEVGFIVWHGMCWAQPPQHSHTVRGSGDNVPRDAVQSRELGTPHTPKTLSSACKLPVDNNAFYFS